MDEDNADVHRKTANALAQQETGQRGSTNGLWSINFFFWGGGVDQTRGEMWLVTFSNDVCKQDVGQ